MNYSRVSTKSVLQVFRSFSVSSSLPSNLIKTAGCIIIGDEVLNSKISDTNSKFFGKYCFQHGIQLNKVSIIGDVELEIISTVKEFDSKYDLIITSGGIGPTHDDVTYQTIAKAYNLKQEIDLEAKEKMYKTYAHLIKSFTEEQINANLKMVYLPKGENVKTFYAPALWVPIVNINDKLNILPGIPKLFENMLLNGIHKDIENRLDTNLEFVSFYISTNVRESLLAPFLTKLSQELKGTDTKIGSYPHKALNSVSITGRKRDLAVLRSLVDRCVTELNGNEISRQEEELLSSKSYEV